MIKRCVHFEIKFTLTLRKTVPILFLNDSRGFSKRVALSTSFSYMPVDVS